jgi:hypothetical protein
VVREKQSGIQSGIPHNLQERKTTMIKKAKIAIQEWYEEAMASGNYVVTHGKKLTIYGNTLVIMSLFANSYYNHARFTTTVYDRYYSVKRAMNIRITGINADEWDGGLVVEYCGFYHTMQYTTPERLFYDLSYVMGQCYKYTLDELRRQDRMG